MQRQSEQKIIKMFSNQSSIINDIQLLDFPNKVTNQYLHSLIDTDCSAYEIIEATRLNSSKNSYSRIVCLADQDGLKKNKPINILATILCHRNPDNINDYIRGNILIVRLAKNFSQEIIPISSLEFNHMKFTILGYSLPKGTFSYPYYKHFLK